MPWTPPDDYQPMHGVSAHLLRLVTPKVGSAEFKIVVMVTHNKTPTEVNLTPGQARTAIDERIVPTGLYPSILATALAQQ